MKIDYPRAGRTGLRRFLPSWRQWLLLSALGLLGLIAVFVIAYVLVPVPQPNDQALAQTSIIYYTDEKTELGRFGAANRVAVPLEDVPVSVRYAVMAAEDRSFVTNRGIDFSGVLRALWHNLRSDSTQGASTITQQYVKNVYLTQARTYSRKLREWVIAIKINNSETKDTILENYLNTIYWGRGAYGISTAAQAYFGKDVSRLTPSEGAFLAGIIQAPSRLDPLENPKGARARWAYVVHGMATLGADEASQASRQARQAGFPKVAALQARNRFGGPLGYLIAMVRDELRTRGISEERLDAGGLRIISTFDRALQQAAQKAVEDGFPKRNAKNVHAGLAAVVPGSGQIVALYGGPDYVKAPGQNAALAKIQGGSTFKPFTLAAALRDNIALRSRFAGNSPFRLPDGQKVGNEFNTNYGQYVTLRQAIEKSINTAFVDLTMHVGPDKVRAAIVDAGIPSTTPGLNANPVITLGTASVNAVEMANAYATFAAEGVRVDEPFTVLKVSDDRGHVIYQAKPRKTRAFDANIAANVSDALVGVVDRGTGTAALAVGRPVAGKTGTAEDKTAWFVGYAPKLAAAVEFYNGDGTKSLDQVGGRATFFGGGFPAEIWTDFMSRALKGSEVDDFPKPEFIGRTINPAPRFTPTPTPTPTGSGAATGAPSGSPSPSPTSSPDNAKNANNAKNTDSKTSSTNNSTNSGKSNNKKSSKNGGG